METTVMLQRSQKIQLSLQSGQSKNEERDSWDSGKGSVRACELGTQIILGRGRALLLMD